MDNFLNQLPKDKVLMFHSSIKSIGINLNINEFISDIIKNSGSSSTIVMPTFNFDFAKTHLFDIDNTPSHNGILTEYFRSYTGVKRILNPMQPVAIYGKNQDKYLNSKCETTFGKDSVFDMMYNDDAYIVLIGVDYNKISFYHYLEEKFNVPYRFWKTFSGEIINQKERTQIDYKMFARKLEYMPNINHYGLLLEELGLVNKFFFHKSIVRIFKFNDLYNLLEKEILRDPFSLVNTCRDTWEIKTTNHD